MPCSECGKTTEDEQEEEEREQRITEEKERESMTGRVFVRQRPKSPFQSIRIISC